MYRLHNALVGVHPTDICEVFPVSGPDLERLGIEPVMNDPRDGQIHSGRRLRMRDCDDWHPLSNAAVDVGEFVVERSVVGRDDP